MEPEFPNRSIATFATAVAGQIRPGYWCRTAASATAADNVTEHIRFIQPSTRTPTTLNSLADADSRFTTIDGLTVHHKAWAGDSHRPNLVCIHGFGASLFSFENVAPHLMRLGPVSAFDITGFGLTQRPRLRQLWRYSPLFAARVATVLPPGARTAGRVLIAHSMGALAATEAARGEGSNVRALVLIAPAITCAWGGRAVRSAGLVFALICLLVTVILDPVICILLRLVVSKQGFWESGLAAARAGGASATSAIVRGYRRPLRAPGWERGILNFVRCMLLYRAATAGSAARALALIARDTPVLIVHGTEDRLVPASNSRTLKKLIPEIELVEMPNVGHVPHEDKPEEFARIVSSFLNAHGIS